MTRLEVLDDAVKIGLGAAITLVGVLATNHHQRKREFQNRRMDVIQKGANEFQKASEVFIQFYAAYAAYLLPRIQSNAEARDLAWEKVFQIMMNDISPALLSMISLEASLTVVGAKKSAKLIADFRSHATAVQSMAVPSDGGSEKAPSLQQFGDTWNKAEKSSKVVFDALESDYRAS